MMHAILFAAVGIVGTSSLAAPQGERVTLDGITFDSTIPCGNGRDFRRVGPDHYRFRARVGREPYAWRFFFKIECARGAGREITLEVADFNHAGRTVFHESATAWSTDARRWHALEPQRMAIVGHTPPEKPQPGDRYGDRSHVPYGVRYRLRLAGPQVWFAVPTPYTLRHRDEFLDRLAAAHPERVRLIAVGHSLYSSAHGWPIRGLRMGKPGEEAGRRNVVIIAGEHAAESAGMYACEGWMEEVLAHPEWLDRYVFYFVPVVNVDGVFYGTSYYNVPASAESPGENIGTAWRARRLPEVEALWPRLARWRPVFFASLHNGRHRTTMEAYGPAGPGTDVLVAAWRRALGFPFEGVRAREGSRAWNRLCESGLTPLAYTIETLLLCRQKGCDSFAESYILTGRQLARGTMAALDALGPGGATTPPMLLSGADFSAQLPWFYHGLPFDRSRPHDIWSFEVNGLDLEPGEYRVALLPGQDRSALDVGFDGERFESLPVRDGRVEIGPLRIDNRMLSLYTRAPLETVLVWPAGADFARARQGAVPFKAYRRDIRLAEREILGEDSWDEFSTLLRRGGFGARELRAMFDDLLSWCARRQVLDPKNTYYGAVYSEEDKYDFRDAAAAAVVFTHAWRDTKDPRWRQRAMAARSYTYKGQHVEDPRNSDQYGAFCQMVDGLWGPPFRRLGPALPKVTGVETCIAVNHLVKTIELGLEPSAEDLRRLELAARWVAASEFRPGVFHHHEGSEGDCQNSNALAAMALARAHQALETLGRRPPAAWLEAARRGMRHYIEGQEAIGVWPYLFATIGRGQAFHERNIPDEGMGVYHFLVACRTPALQNEARAEDRMRRAARWWLSTSRIDRGGPRATIDLDDRRTSGSLKFSAFTWCRFMAAASLLRIARSSGETEPWRSLALRYMEHVSTKLWNRTDPRTAPVRRATRDDMTLCSWIQAAEWDAALLRDMEESLLSLPAAGREP